MSKNVVSRYILFAAILPMALSCGSLGKSGKKVNRMAGTWQAKPVVIDGDCTDWPSPYPNYDSKAMVAYATSNDATYLYVTVQSGDPLTQIKILKQGLSLSIDTSGFKNTGFTINFPLQNTDDLAELFAQAEGQKGGPSRLSRQFDQKLKKSLESANQFSLEGFGDCNGGYMVSQTTPCGIKVSMNIDEYKQLVWEAAIPMSTLYGKTRITAADAGKLISVCYTVKGFKSPSTKGGDNTGMPMNNNMGQGGMGQAGMNSMPRGANVSTKSSSPLAHLYETTKTWKFFSLMWGN